MTHPVRPHPDGHQRRLGGIHHPLHHERRKVVRVAQVEGLPFVIRRAACLTGGARRIVPYVPRGVRLLVGGEGQALTAAAFTPPERPAAHQQGQQGQQVHLHVPLPSRLEGGI